MFKEYRNQFSDTRWNRFEIDIQHHVLVLIHKLHLNSVGCYIQSKKSREVSTDMILKSLLSNGVQTCVPVVGEDFSMEMVLISYDTTYETNKWGISEPARLNSDLSIVPEGIVVPMLGADLKGYRVGYGKGYYDRYLSKNKTLKIGICPQVCVIEELPIDEYDIPMDYLITENGIIRRNAK